ncbi:hypothetical protein D3C76_1304950 [compost metagenome]
MGGHRQRGHDLHTFDLQLAFERRQGDSQSNGCGAWAGQARGQFEAGDAFSIGFRHHSQGVVEAAGQVDDRAACLLGLAGEAAADGWAGGEKGQFDLSEVEAVHFPDFDLLAGEHHAAARRLHAGQQVQRRDRELQFFKDLNEGFTDATGSADDGDVQGLGHGGDPFAETAGGGTLLGL